MISNYLKLTALMLLGLVAFFPSQAQQVGTPNGSTFFVNTGNAGFGNGGQLGHIQSGTFGSFTGADRWIGIGNPRFSGGLLPVYGFRIQDAGQAATMSLNNNSGTTKDFELQWGPDDNSKFRVSFLSDPTNPSSLTTAITANSRGWVGIGQDNPSNGRLEVTNFGSGAPTYAAYFNNLLEGKRGSFSRGNSYGAYNEAGAVLSIGSILTKGSFATYSINNGGSGGVWFGSYGRAFNAPSANYGVFGTASDNDGDPVYGVYGSASTSTPNSWAGYFQGNLTYTGTFTHTSDRKLKKNIEGETAVMDQIMALRPSTYEYRTDGKLGSMNLAEGRQHGFIAQELEEVFPELVEETVHMLNIDEIAADPNTETEVEEVNYKAVNYVALIPILTKGMQEQQATIETLTEELENVKAELAAVRGDNASKGDAASGINEASVLYQNTPNPFDRNTTIRYEVAKSAGSAELLVFDMNGRQLRSFTNLNAGENSIVLEGAELEAGMYFYSLVVDGAEVATKRMILTN